MKIFLILLLTISFNLSAQEVRSAYVGTSLSIDDGQYFILQAESDIDIALLRVEFRSNFIGDDKIFLKMAFRVYHTNNFSFYLAMPPMYYKLGKGYITPFNAEIRYKKYLTLNVDVYKNKPIISIQARLPICKKLD